jgi:hypothetical protein
MINLKKIQKEEVLIQQPLGLEEDSAIKIFLSKSKKKIGKLNTEAKYSGLYKNFWFINVVLLNLSIITVLYFFILKNYETLPSMVGINYNNAVGYDVMLSKSFIYFPVFLHIIVIIFAIFFAIKGQKKLNHLFIVSFFNILALGVFEILGVYNLINYFS